jgi:hypothetical protein
MSTPPGLAAAKHTPHRHGGNLKLHTSKDSDEKLANDDEFSALDALAAVSTSLGPVPVLTTPNVAFRCDICFRLKVCLSLVYF